MVHLVAAATASILLAGCTVEPPAPEPEPPVMAAVLDEPQELKILERVSEVVESTDQADESGALTARLSGPALVMRKAELALAGARGDTERLADLTTQMQQVVLPSDQGWPRTSYGIGVQPPSPDTPVLMVFEQAAAREQYKLWGYVELLPGVTLPRFAEAALGSPAVALDDTSLKMPPRVVAERYTSVLSAGEEAPHADAFAADELRDLLREYGQSQVETIAKEGGKGSFELAYEPPGPAVKAVRTADGGALVLAAVASQETTRAEEHWKLGPRTLSATALWGDAERTDVMRIAYREMMAFYVPPKESADQIALVGHHRVPYAVSNH